jgi:hypothetical protein
MAVRDIVGPQIFETSALLADGVIRETSGKYQLTLRMTKDGAQQEREVDAVACHDLLGASAIVLGLHLKRIAAEENPPASRAASAESSNAAVTAGSARDGQRAAPPRKGVAIEPATEPPSKPTTLEPALTRTFAPRNRPFWLALPQAGIVVGSLPEPAWTGGVSVGWSRDKWRMWVSGRYQLPQKIVAVAVPSVAAVVDKYTAEVGVSHSWRSRHFDAAPGLFAGVDYLVARSAGENVTAASPHQTFAFVGGGMVLRWLARDWMSVALGAVGELPLSRPSLQVQSLGEIDQISPVHLRVSLGLEWNF